MTAREIALDALIACRKQGAWSNGVLKECLAQSKVDKREAALASRLCYGVLQNRGRLDFYLKQLLTGKLKDLHPALRDILHLGLYQIYWMDKIPESAAVNESVTLAKKYCKQQKFAPGLVNGVLRNSIRTKGTLQEPTSLEDRYSHPRELIDLLRQNVGAQRLEKMLEANNATPPITVQVNTVKTGCKALMEQLQAEDVQVQLHPWLKDCLILSNTGSVDRLKSFRDGLFYVQDAAARLSIFCAQIPEDAKSVLDCCAAPGGKSFSAAMAMQGKSSVISCDIHSHKVELIQKSARRLGLSNIRAMEMDATAFVEAWEQTMDVVIADVPCSGYGIIRKKPDIRYKDPKTMEQLPQLQLQILNNQARYVKPGGTLLYSTCTLLKRENEAVVEAFLKQQPDYETIPLPLPEIFPENTSGMLTLVPGEYDTDGFFICRLRRKL